MLIQLELLLIVAILVLKVWWESSNRDKDLLDRAKRDAEFIDAVAKIRDEVMQGTQHARAAFKEARNLKAGAEEQTSKLQEGIAHIGETADKIDVTTVAIKEEVTSKKVNGD